LPTFIQAATRIQSAGNLPKLIDEYVGRVNSREDRISIAHMRSPAGWQEPAQTPEFAEFTIVLSGCLRVEYDQGTLEVAGGQAVIAHPGERVRYSTPDEATEYIAICVPAFSVETAHRDETAGSDQVEREG
jgi:ethanolamine utilization protein EutQ